MARSRVVIPTHGERPHRFISQYQPIAFSATLNNLQHDTTDACLVCKVRYDVIECVRWVKAEDTRSFDLRREGIVFLDR